MANRNVDKGREAENAVVRVMRDHGMPHAERRSKRGGTVALECLACAGRGHLTTAGPPSACGDCSGVGEGLVPADAGDITGVPGVVVQVKWSAYKSLNEDMRRTDEQRRVARAPVGLLVRKRKGVGLARAGEWDAHLPLAQVADLFDVGDSVPEALRGSTWTTDLASACALIAAAGYGDHSPAQVDAGARA